MFLFSELGVIHGEEPLPIPAVESIPDQCNKKAVQIMLLLVTIRITVGIGTRMAWQIVSLTLYNHFSSQLEVSFQELSQLTIAHPPKIAGFSGSSGASELT